MSRWCVLAGIILALTCVAAAADPPPPGPSTLAQEANKLYETAMSQYSKQQWKEAQPLLDKFVTAYPTHEFTPEAYMQLAYCHFMLKNTEAYEKALDEVIAKFYGSPCWLGAYGCKLTQARNKKDNDAYLTLVDNLFRQCEDVPYTLVNSADRYGANRYPQWGMYDYEPTAAMPYDIVNPPNWIMDLAAMADTQPRAERALKALAQTVQRESKQFPPDWQFAHVLLLRKAGKTDEADKALKTYQESWGEDPRGISLAMLDIGQMQAAKDDKGADTAYEALSKKYMGYANLETPIAVRLDALFAADRFDEFMDLAKQYLAAYNTAIYYDRVLSLAGSLAAKDTDKRLAAVAELEEKFCGNHPLRQANWLIRKFDICITQKKYEEAAKVAAVLIDEKHWCLANYNLLVRYAGTDPAIAKVIEDAGKKWGIPAPDPTSRALPLLEQLKTRLKADETRHAEELGEELFAKYPQDAATIEAVKTLADYYFAKVLVEPRDKWMARMVKTYPTHPFTQSVLDNQITAEKSAQHNDALAAAIDTAIRSFPGVAATESWIYLRMGCYDVAKDPAGKLGFVQRTYGAMADAGEIRPLSIIASLEEADYSKDYKYNYQALGDQWSSRAKRYAGSRLEAYCQTKAFNWYYTSPYWSNRNPAQSCWALAAGSLDALRAQKYDPEIRWKLEFADINLNAEQGNGSQVLKLLNDRLKDGTTIRDLSLRLDFMALGNALGNNGLTKEAEALAKRLEKICFTDRDKAAINLMLGLMYQKAKNLPSAAASFAKVVDDSKYPALAYWWYVQTASCLRTTNPQLYTQTADKYARRISKVQELLPDINFDIGMYYLGQKNAAGVQQVQKILRSKYPASEDRDKFDSAVDKAK